jgi:peptidoglycan hydrolase-like protein with peptidoglycan-binding domain
MKSEKGCLIDNRKPKEKLKDFKDSEIELKGGVQYLTKKEADKSKGVNPVLNQKITSACVMFAIVTALFATEKKRLSPAFLYPQRFNKPKPGSYLYDGGDIAVQQGVCEEEVLPTPLKEAEINAVKITDEARDNARLYKQRAYVFLDDLSIDTIADKLNNGYSVVFAMYGNNAEWGREYPEVKSKTLTPDNASIRHAICALPNSAHEYKGKKYIIIQDSAHFGKVVFRYLSEDYIKARVTSAMYFIDMDFDTSKPAPYTFTQNLTVGSTGIEVLVLQKTLQTLGFFPVNVNPTGYFGGISRQAVKNFQEAYKTDILIAWGLKSGTGYFGRTTRAKLNKLIN